jgi:hypothetical protein
MAVLMSSCISLATNLEQGRSGVLMVIILEGVGVEVQNDGTAEDNEFDGVEQKPNLWDPRTCPLLLLLQGLSPGKPGQQDGVEACECNGSDTGVPMPYMAEQASGLPVPVAKDNP